MCVPKNSLKHNVQHKGKGGRGLLDYHIFKVDFGNKILRWSCTHPQK